MMSVRMGSAFPNHCVAQADINVNADATHFKLKYITFKDLTALYLWLEFAPAGVEIAKQASEHHVASFN